MSGVVERPLFVFELFYRDLNADGNDTRQAHVPSTVGVFPDLWTCSYIESIAREFRLPTAQCKEWRPIDERIERGELLD